MTEKLDKSIKEALINGTDESIEIKGEVYKNIMKNIDKRKSEQKNHNRGFLKIVSVGTAAAIMLLIFTIATPTGQAAFDRIKALFEPEKSIVEELEGMEENTDITLNESQMGYVIYFDTDMFRMESKDGVDVISPINQADYTPDVSMEISQIIDKSPLAVATEIYNSLNGKYLEVSSTQEISNPVEGLNIHAVEGYEWDSTVVSYYIIDNEANGTFVIKLQYFMEASEGFGARFENMLKEFHIVPAE